MKKNKKVYIWLPLVIAVSVAAGIFIGNSFINKSTNSSFWRTGNTSKIDQILGHINRSYVDTVDTNQLIEKAIPSLISELDPHSTYFSSEFMEVKGGELDGHFGGIGVEFMLFRDTIAIVNVVEGGPSEAAGLKASDRVVYVDDSLYVGKELSEDGVMKRLRGKKSTQVKLGIKRANANEIVDYIITRADVPMKSVVTAHILEDDIGYIKVSRFAITTYDEFISAVAKLKSLGAKSLILDLQQNTGGYMGASIKMANEFLSGGELIVYTEGRSEPREEVHADNSGMFKSEPLIVLIDEGSASASEIVAGAIQDNDRGLIVGRRSFGKGLVQRQYDFTDGSAMRLTIARYHTPSGRCIQKKYEKGKSDEYSRDLLNRYMRGEFDSRDSIKLDSLPLFHTNANRPVYGDDGILADVFVPRDTLGFNSYYMQIANSGSLKEFAFSFTDKNRQKLQEMKNWEEAVKFLQNQNLVNQLVDYAAINKNIRRRPYLIEESRKLLASNVEAIIIRNVFGDEGFYKTIYRDDTTMATAIDLIKAGKAGSEAVAAEKYLN